MSNQSNPLELDAELSAIEAALGSLALAQSRLDRDRVMYRAGQAAARRSSPLGRRVLIAIAASAGFVALGEAAMLARRPGPRIIERIVVVREREPAPGPVAVAPPGLDPEPVTQRAFGSFPSFGATASERLAAQVFRYGLDGLPASPSMAGADPGSAPLPSRRLLEEELHKFLESGDPS